MKFSKIGLTFDDGGIQLVYRYREDVARYIQYVNETREDVVRIVITPVDGNDIPDASRLLAEAIRSINGI